MSNDLTVQNKSEYATLKRKAYSDAADAGIHRRTVQGKMNAANQKAYDALDEKEKAKIDRVAKNITDKVKGIGAIGALELIASIGSYLNHESER